MRRLLVDTNVLVRFLTGDPPEMAQKARALVQRADDGKAVLVVPPVIVAEVFYTLESFYEMERKVVSETLLSFLQCRGIEAVEGNCVMDALARRRERNVHFADAYLAACAAGTKYPVASFDRDFAKFKDVERVELK